MARRRLNLDELATDELLRRGIAAARVDEDDEARLLLEEAVLRDPQDPDAWLWLAGVRSEPRAKREAFDRVLALRPGDVDATTGLERLSQKFGAGVLADVDDGLAMLRCTWHPERETLLRCNRCDRPMCPDCSRQHPVGLRCKACAKETRSPLYQVDAKGWLGAAVLGAFGGLAAGVLVTLLFGLVGGFFSLIVGVLAGGPLGAGVAEAVSRGSGRKRGRGLQWLTGVAIIGGALAASAFGWLTGLWPLNVLGLLAYLASGVSGAAARLR